ncbi:unnamed protein product [Blepharisma stoltei]|uniref:Dickkopf N-terminal cysteine-rich domain-containing protein n=1 Tax=Blepharisma stoltei TaxID=1481888 RepID=A0AAU9IP01_9CILI|nr:unnamed protein product [Blepharisma stoltei]
MLPFSLLFLIIGVSYALCPSYQCKPRTMPFKDNICVFYDEHTLTYRINPCEDPFQRYCIFNPLQNSTCSVSSKKSLIQKYPGEKCSTDEDCRYPYFGGCTDEICLGSIKDGYCSDSSFCSPGLYCKYNTCISQLQDGDQCTYDYECQNGSGCDGNICKKYFSAKLNEEVNTCKDNVNYICESTLCYTNATTSFSYCITPLARRNKSPECLSDNDCYSRVDRKSGVMLKSECQCGMNPDGKQYCGILPGDVEFMYYIRHLKKWYNSTEVKNCNTLRRDARQCIEEHWDEDEAVKLIFYKERVVNFANIQENDYCAETVLNADFFVLAHKMGHLTVENPHEILGSSQGSVIWLGLSLIFLILN